MGEGQPNFETSKIRGILSVKFFLLYNCTPSRWLELAFHGWFSLRMKRCSMSIFFPSLAVEIFFPTRLFEGCGICLRQYAQRSQSLWQDSWDFSLHKVCFILKRNGNKSAILISGSFVGLWRYRVAKCFWPQKFYYIDQISFLAILAKDMGLALLFTMHYWRWLFINLNQVLWCCFAGAFQAWYAHGDRHSHPRQPGQCCLPSEAWIHTGKETTCFPDTSNTNISNRWGI